MSLYHLKSVVVSLAVATALGSAAGIVYALVADQTILYGVATGLMVASILVLGGGLLGATEPPEGWITGRGTGRGQFGRRSLVARIASEHPDIEEVSSWELAAWAVIVGGLLLGGSILLFELAR
ncbi:MAG: hypothetical protein M3134_07925 [Actinomycetota bacterium]|nr:hypothetical protein [Actinomycetota bacterium]